MHFLLLVFYILAHFEVPNFELMDPILCDQIHVGDHHGYDLCLQVKFANGTKSDIILLNKIDGEDTVYEGILLKEKCHVSVMREESSILDKIEVLILD